MNIEKLKTHAKTEAYHPLNSKRMKDKHLLILQIIEENENLKVLLQAEYLKTDYIQSKLTKSIALNEELVKKVYDYELNYTLNEAFCGNESLKQAEKAIQQYKDRIKELTNV